MADSMHRPRMHSTMYSGKHTESDHVAADALLQFGQIPLPIDGFSQESSRKSTVSKASSKSRSSERRRIEAQMKMTKVLAEQQIEQARIQAELALKEAEINAAMRKKLLECELAMEEAQASTSSGSEEQSEKLENRLREFDDEEMQEQCKEWPGTGMVVTTSEPQTKDSCTKPMGSSHYADDVQDMSRVSLDGGAKKEKFEMGNSDPQQDKELPESELERKPWHGESGQQCTSNLNGEAKHDPSGQSAVGFGVAGQCEVSQPLEVVCNDNVGVTAMKQDVNGSPQSTSRHNGLNASQGQHNGGTQDMNMAIMKHLSLLQKRMELPKPDMKGFAGDPLDFPRFKTAFLTNIASRTDDPQELYQYLRKYCTGQAAEIIKKYDLLPANQAYTEATNELYREYGQPHMITQAFDQKLQKTAEIKPGDKHEFRKLAELLETAQLSLASIQRDSALDHPTYMVEILSKLPHADKRAWLKEAARIRTERRNKPNADVVFKDVVKFVKGLSSELNDSEFSVLVERKPKKAMGVGEKGQARSAFATSSGGTSHSAGNDKPKSMKPASRNENKGDRGNGQSSGCSVCSANHKIWECQKLKAKPWKQRLEVIKGENLCFNCLNADGKLEHSSVRNCPLPKECKVEGCKASRKHHTLLHFDERKKTVEVENSCTEMTSQVYFPAFPVRVKSVATGKEIITWAGIDSYSSACFCENSLLDELGIEHAEEKISINTLQGSYDGYSTTVELLVSGMDDGEPIRMKEVYSWERLPMGSRHIPSKDIWSKYPHLADLPISTSSVDRIRLLVGSNIPDAHRQLEWRPGEQNGDTVAVRYEWGWTLFGGASKAGVDCNFMSVESNGQAELNRRLMNMAEFEYAGTKYDFGKPMSADDVKVQSMFDRDSYLCEGHYYIPIPLKESYVTMPNNRELAERRLMSVKRKLEKGKTVCEGSSITEYDAYKETFENYRKKGYIRKIPADEIAVQSGEVVNYIPYHHVYHPAKSGKLRLVWDAAAQYRGSCLNKHVYPGEDNINSLLGVLLRFRMGGECAIHADINAMFNQVYVPRHQWNLLRFLWFKNDNTLDQVEEYQLLHNFFGGTHAPGVAGYALKRTCQDNSSDFHPEVVNTGLRDTYVDDVYKSTDFETAEIIVKQIFNMMDRGGLELAKFVSNDPRLTELVEPSRRAEKPMDEFEFRAAEECQERVLGVTWDIKEDEFLFKSRAKERSMTRRGLLGHIASLFDPEGSISPVTLPPKQILQKVTRQGLGWDEQLPAEDEEAIRKWLKSIPELSSARRQRYIVPKGFGPIVSSELHAMSDGSESGYGFVIFGRYVNEQGMVHMSFLMAKSLVTPAKVKTIPRIELQAFVLSMRAIKFVTKEGVIQWNTIYQWVDSQAVLAMVKNERKRFLPYCANRLQEVRDIQAELKVELRHVPGTLNVADMCSRGLSIDKFLKQDQFYQGPAFLWSPQQDWPANTEVEDLPEDFPELKREATTVTVQTVEKCDEPLMKLIERHSSWTSETT